MAILDTHLSSGTPSASHDLDPCDRLILTLERDAPGPHPEAAGMSLKAYMARIRRLLYDREANEIAPAVLARLRTELCSRRDRWSTD